jgi:hypothetical protein
MGLATAQPSLRSPNPLARCRALLARYRWYLLIPALYTLLTIVLLWPLVAHITSAVAETIGDPLLNAWTLRWVQHALITNPTHLYDGNMFAPNARSLAFSELLLPQAILAWPVWLFSHDALLAYNLSVLVTYPMCAAAMYALCRALGANRGAAFLAGVCFAFAPFRLDNTAHLQVLSMQWMPLALLAIIRYVQRPSRARFVGVAGTVALSALSSVYYLMMFGTGLAIFLLVEMIRQRRTLLARGPIRSHPLVGLVVALALAGAIIGALDVPYLTMRREQNIVRTLDEAYDDSAHPTSYFTVTPGNYVWGRVLPQSGVERSALFPGAILLFFAAAGLWRLRRPWMVGLFAMGALSFVLSFGPTWGDKETGFPLPYRLLYQYVVGYQGIRGPDRFAAVVLLALCPFAALGATRLWQAAVWRRPQLIRFGALIAVLVSAVALGESAARLLPTIPVDRSASTLATYRWLASQHDVGTIAEFPVDTAQDTTAFYSTYHWHDVLWGHSGFIPAPTYQLRARFTGKNDFPGPDDIAALADMGVRTLVVHRSMYPDGMADEIARGLARSTPPVTRLASVGDADIYHILPDPSEPPVAIQVAFQTNPLGNLDRLHGRIVINNPGANARMLYTRGALAVAAETYDVSGHMVAREPLDLTLPAITPPGSITVPIAVDLPQRSGAYSIRIVSKSVQALADQPATSVNVISLTTLPNLTFANDVITSPPLYMPNESVAMWATTKEGKTIALPDTTAQPDGTLHVALISPPADTVRIVAHGKSSGVELWVAPP